jgi:hypothetical protein
VANLLAGHVRFDVNGLAEFATGWDETVLTKQIVSGNWTPELVRNRGWVHAYATPEGAEPFEAKACSCGARPPIRTGLNKPFVPRPRKG